MINVGHLPYMKSSISGHNVMSCINAMYVRLSSNTKSGAVKFIPNESLETILQQHMPETVKHKEHVGEL